MYLSRIDRDKYDPIGKIGEGTYGLVYKAHVMNPWDGKKQYVAVKKFKSFKNGDGISPTAIREIKLLRELSHKYIVNLMDVMLDPDDKSLYLVFDYAEHDLLDIIRCHHSRSVGGMAMRTWVSGSQEIVIGTGGPDTAVDHCFDRVSFGPRACRDMRWSRSWSSRCCGRSWRE